METYPCCLHLLNHCSSLMGVENVLFSVLSLHLNFLLDMSLFLCLKTHPPPPPSHHRYRTAFSHRCKFSIREANNPKSIPGYAPHIVHQEKIRGQRGKLPVQTFGYVNSAKVIYRWALERKSVFRDVRIKANLDLMFLVKAK